MTNTPKHQANRLDETELPDYQLDYCDKCNQMTNHLMMVCQKCKATKGEIDE